MQDTLQTRVDTTYCFELFVALVLFNPSFCMH